jgi:hypothetical protein
MTARYQIVRACPIDYAADVRGLPYKKGKDVDPETLKQLQGLLDDDDIEVEMETAEPPYNAVLINGTERHLAQLDPPPRPNG